MTQQVQEPTAPNEQYVSQFTELMQDVKDAGLLERRHIYYWWQIGAHVAAFFAIWVGFFLLGNSWFQLILAAALGVATGEVKLDFGVAMKRSRQVAEQNSKGVEFLMKKFKVTVIRGTGVLQPGRKVKVGDDVYAAGKALVLATGSRVKGLPQIGLALDKASVISTDEALFLERAPRSLAIVGAGAVVAPEQVRNSYAAADVLVMPSLATRHFLEPWGLVANEAMNQHLPVIATDAVGAAAGGLVRHERNGLVVPAGDAAALAAALRTLHDDPDLRARLGANAARDVAGYTYAAWADGFAAALRGATGQEMPC